MAKETPTMVQAFTPAKGMRGGRLGRGGSGGSVMTQYGYSTPGTNISLSNIGNPVVTQNTGSMTQDSARPVRPGLIPGFDFGDQERWRRGVRGSDGGSETPSTPGGQAPKTSTPSPRTSTSSPSKSTSSTASKRYSGPALKDKTGKKAAKPSVQKYGSDDNKIGGAEAKKIVNRLGSDKGYKKVGRVAEREGVKISGAAQAKLDVGRRKAVTTRKVEGAGKKLDKKEAKNIIKKLDLKKGENKGTKGIIKEAKKQGVKITSSAQKKLDAAIKARKAVKKKESKKKDNKKKKK